MLRQGAVELLADPSVQLGSGEAHATSARKRQAVSVAVGHVYADEALSVP